MNGIDLVGHPTDKDKARLAALDQAAQEAEALQTYGKEVWRKQVEGFTFLSETRGIVQEGGELVTHYTYAFEALADGTFVREGPGQILQCAFSKALISRAHAVPCGQCGRGIWIHHAHEAEDGWICTRERNKRRILRPFKFVVNMVRVFVLSLCGIETEDRTRHPAFAHLLEGVPYENTVSETPVVSQPVSSDQQSLQAWQTGRPMG